MGKTHVSVKSKLYNLGLHLKDATGVQKVAAAVSAAASSSLALVNASTSVPAVESMLAPVSVASVGVAGSDLKLPERLPSVEEKLKVLNAALVELEQPGLSQAEVSRLRCIIQGVNVYQKLYADFVNYRGLESEILELRRQFAAEKAQADS